MSKETELAWAAGLYDGEGSFGIYVYGDNRLHFRFHVGQSGDTFVLQRFRKAVGLGKINGPYFFKRQPDAKPFFQFAIQKQSDCYEAIKLLWPYLSDPKKEQIREALRNNLKSEHIPD